MSHSGEVSSLAQNKTVRLILLWLLAAAMMIAIGIIVYRSLSQKEKRSEAPSAGPVLCAGPEMYTFEPKEKRIRVPARPDCRSPWVRVPAGAVSEIDPSVDIEITFVDGTVVHDGPTKVNYAGLRRGIFHVRSLQEPGWVMVTIER